MVRRLVPFLVAAVLPSTVLAQSADRALLTELAKVKAVDAHSHLLINRVEPAGKALAQQRSATDLRSGCAASAPSGPGPGSSSTR